MTPEERMMLSLCGLSVGDAFGELFFSLTLSLAETLTTRTLPDPPWLYTDDTEMTLSLVESLRRHGHINQDEVAAGFARRMQPHRSYGGHAYYLLMGMRNGADWRTEAAAMFNGSGSFGNGSAMRIAPLGAYFADNLDALKENALLSAEITHTHHEGAAGALAVAVAAAHAWQVRNEKDVDPRLFLQGVLGHVPESLTGDGIKEAIGQSFEPAMLTDAHGNEFDARPAQVAQVLGSGYKVSAQDTVPFALWCAARHVKNYEEALWATASGLGDVDTTCAMVGGIVALSADESTIPSAWIENREKLPEEFELQV